jgi:protein arginine kinase activator
MTLCQRCNKTQATVHLLDIVPPDGEKRERHLCERCAAEEGLTTQKHESINEILSSFIKQSSGVKHRADMTCPDCGITFREFRSHGLLGCPNDYNAFAEALVPLIERAHEGGTQHVGKTPGKRGGEPSKHSILAKLRREMKNAVDTEDYEVAAHLRDQIRELEESP